MILTLISIAAAIVVVVRVICVAAHLSRKEFAGHPLRFAGLALAYPLVGGGALALALGWMDGKPLLLFGIGLLMLADRRMQYK